jgi:hypothetical protein
MMMSASLTFLMPWMMVLSTPGLVVAGYGEG